MGRLVEEWEIKLSLLGALSRSQMALARLLESAADAGEAPSAAYLAALRGNVDKLVGLQRVLAETGAGLRLRKPVRGRPGRLPRPWLHARVTQPSPGEASVTYLGTGSGGDSDAYNETPDL